MPKITLEEFDKKMDKFRADLEAHNYEEDYFEKWQEKVSAFQKEFMEGILEEYKQKITSEEQRYISELLEYAINDSISGNAIVYVPTKEMAEKIDEIIFAEIGEYLLSPPEIYEKDGEWAVDVMFGGYYIPFWDGWLD